MPIIMLTGKGDEVDRIIGLEIGADDYLAKPFNPRELLGAHAQRAAALGPRAPQRACRAACRATTSRPGRSIRPRAS